MKKHRQNYRRLFQSGEMEPVMIQLADVSMDYGIIPKLSQVLYIPQATLQCWRRTLLQNPTFRPYSQPANISKRALTPDQEHRVSEELRSGYLIPGIYCPARVLQTLALQTVDNLAAENNDDDYDDGSDDDDYDVQLPFEPQDEEYVARAVRDDLEFEEDPAESDEYGAPRRKFVAGQHWRRNFMRRWRLALRKPHPKRRPKTDPAQVDAFRLRMADILRRTRPERILNMDETSWRQLNMGFRTIAEKGTETVNCYFRGDAKACLTAIATVDAAGTKLPLWVLARGKTMRCEARYRNHDAIQRAVAQGDLVLSHQVNGWSNGDIILQYLKWLRKLYGRQHIVLLWDIWGAHRSQDTKDLAASLNIQLEFIPAGMTGECQPLDRRIFGNLKSRARSRFDQGCARGEDPTIEDSVAMLLEAWKSIGQEEVIDAWEPLRE